MNEIDTQAQQTAAEGFLAAMHRKDFGQQCADIIVDALRKHYDSDSPDQKSDPRDHVYASQWSRCVRSMAYDVAFGHEGTQFDADTKARMARGKDRESDLQARLIRAGKLSDPTFEIIGAQQRFEIKSRDGQRVILTGKTDFTIRILWKDRAPTTHRAEIKAWSPYLEGGIRTLEDFEDSLWTEGAVYQLGAYLLSSGDELGFFILDRGGIPKLIPVDLMSAGMLDKVEDFLEKSEMASLAGVLHRGGQPLDLPYYTEDRGYCRKCRHFARCLPPEENATPVIVLEQEELLEAARVIEEGKAVAVAVAKAEDTLKKWARTAVPPGVPGIVGRLEVKTSERKGRTSIEIPDDIKRQYGVTVRGESTIAVTIRPATGAPEGEQDAES